MLNFETFRKKSFENRKTVPLKNVENQTSWFRTHLLLLPSPHHHAKKPALPVGPNAKYFLVFNQHLVPATDRNRKKRT